jgi:hypothetical protein
MAVIAVGGLLLLALPVPRVDEDFFAAAGMGNRLRLAARRLGDHVFAPLGPVRVVDAVGVVVRRAAVPERGIVRRQHAHADAVWRRDDHEPRAIRAIPRTALVVVRRP